MLFGEIDSFVDHPDAVFVLGFGIGQGIVEITVDVLETGHIVVDRFPVIEGIVGEIADEIAGQAGGDRKEIIIFRNMMQTKF